MKKKLSNLPLGKLALFGLPIFWLGFATILIIGTNAYLLTNPKALAATRNKADHLIHTTFDAVPKVLGTAAVRLGIKDARAVALEQYLAYHRSPLASYSIKMVKEADRWEVDWKLFAAIAGQESTFCRTIPEYSYNCWGWAITSSQTKKFTSFDHAIERITRSLREDFLDQGLLTPEQIMTKYCPESLKKGGSWAKGVNYFIWQLDNFNTR